MGDLLQFPTVSRPIELSKAEAARSARKSTRTIELWAKKRGLKYHRNDAGHMRIFKSDLDAFCEARGAVNG